VQHQGGWQAAFSPNSKTLLTVSSDKKGRLLDTATGTLVGPPLQHQDQVLRLAFSPTGKP